MENLPSFDLNLAPLFSTLNSSKELRALENKTQGEIKTYCEPVLYKELDYYLGRASLIAQLGKNLPAMQETLV